MTPKTFKSAIGFRKWLAKNHTQLEGIWLRINKKNSDQVSVTYAEALDEALCYGWIDGQKKAHDSFSWLQKFTPRRAKSGWSKVNTQHVERLIKECRMQPAGLREVEAAKADGRWGRAYDSFKASQLPEDFLKEVSKDKPAKAFLDSLNKTNIYSIVYRLQTAKKPETRERRMKAILAMLRKGQKFHP